MRRFSNNIYTCFTKGKKGSLQNKGVGAMTGLLRFAAMLLLVAMSFPTTGQTLKDLKTFNDNIAPRFSPYFGTATLSASGVLQLTATSRYSALTLVEKKEIMDVITTNWNKSLVLVINNDKREMWSLDSRGEKSVLLDIWDTATTKNIRVAVQGETEKTNLHPWFFYGGGLISYDSSDNLNLAINTRVGFFMLKDRWDLALTWSGGTYGSTDDDSGGNLTMSVGLMSKVYFPIKKIGLSPNVGAELSYNYLNSASDVVTKSTDLSAVFGVSWYVWKGSLDVEVVVGDNVTAMIGYTFFPGTGK